MKISPTLNRVQKNYPLGALIWLLAGCFFLYEFFIRAFMGSIAMPYQMDLMLSPAQFSLIASAYYIAYSPMQIPVGLLMDRFGTRLLISLGALFCSLGTILFSYATHFNSAWLARFLMGLGSSVGFISLLTISLNWLPTRLFGFFSGMTQTLGAIGPILSGAPLAYWMLASHNNWSLILRNVGLAGLVLTLILACFIRNQPRGRSFKKENHLPLLNALKYLLGQASVRRIAIYALCIYAAVPLIGEIWGIPYLQARGFSLTQASTMIASLWLGMAIGNPIVGLISDALARRKIILALSAFLGIVSSGCFIFVTSLHPLFYSSLLFLIGVAASGQTLSFAIMAESVPTNMKSTAMGLNNCSVMLGGILSQSLAGFILNHFWQGPSGQALSITAYQMALFCSFLFFSLAALFCFRLKETYARSQA